MAQEVYIAVKTIRELVAHASTCSVAKDVCEHIYDGDEEERYALIFKLSDNLCVWCNLVKNLILQMRS